MVKKKDAFKFYIELSVFELPFDVHGLDMIDRFAILLKEGDFAIMHIHGFPLDDGYPAFEPYVFSKIDGWENEE